MEGFDVEAVIAASGLSDAQIARRAGLSGSTIHRVRRGLTDPSLGTLREIAIACGVDLRLAAVPLSDGDAARAARWILEGAERDQLHADRSVVAWAERLHRQAASRIGILTHAARAADPFIRPGSRHYAGAATTAMLASAGSAAGGEWAISGTPGLVLPERQEPFAGHGLLWVADAELASSLLGNSLREVPHPTIADVTVAQAAPDLFEGSFDVDSVRYAAPIQIMLDCIALGGDAESAAMEIVSTW